MQRKSSLKKQTPIHYLNQFKQQMDVLNDEVQIFNTRQNNIYSTQNTSRYTPKDSGYLKTEKYEEPMALLIKNKKILLKKMTEPKYHKSVIKHLTDREKQWIAGQQKTASMIRKSNSIKKSVINEWIERVDTEQIRFSCKKIGKQNKIGDVSYNSEIIPTCIASKQNISRCMNDSGIRSTKSQPKIRINMRKMQKKLEREWIKTEKYRNSMNITDRVESESSVCCYQLPNVSNKIRKQREIIEKVKVNRAETSLLSYVSRVDTQFQFKGDEGLMKEIKQIR